MKKLFKILLLVVFLMGVSEVNAQIKAGGGVYYATEMESIGISVNGAYFFSDNFSLAPSFTYFFKKNNVTHTMLDVDLNYQFAELDFAYVYGLAGLNLSFYKVDMGGAGDISGSDTNFNLGAGLAMPLSDNMTFCPELKYTFGGGDFFRIGIKLLVDI